MKIVISSLFLASMFATATAEARYIGPTLVKTASTGFVAPAFTKAETCEVFANRTVISSRFGVPVRLTSVETRNIALDGDLIDLLRKAARAELLQLNGPVDGPTVKYYGVLVNPDDSLRTVLLYEENGGSGQLTRNPSQEALLLKNVIESLCANTKRGIGSVQVE